MLAWHADGLERGRGTASRSRAAHPPSCLWYPRGLGIPTVRVKALKALREYLSFMNNLRLRVRAAIKKAL